MALGETGEMTTTAMVPERSVTKSGAGVLEEIWFTARRYPLGTVGATILLLLLLLSIFGPNLAPYDPLASVPADRLKPPSAAHWFGTDDFGRDVLSRIMVGGRNSFVISLSAVILGTVVGATLGMLSGYCGGTWDLLLQRLIDMTQAFPLIVLALLLMAAFGPSLLSVTMAIAIGIAPRTARIARGGALSVRHNTYVEAAVAVAASHPRILIRYILPNLVAPLITFSTAQVGVAIVLESSLSFLGAGVPPDSASWGRMLTNAARYVNAAPWLAIIPGVVLSLAVFSVNVLGDAIRDITDPRLRRTQQG